MIITAEWSLEEAIAVACEEAREEEREEAEERFAAKWQRAETERQKFIALLRTAGISDEKIAQALRNSTN